MEAESSWGGRISTEQVMDLDTAGAVQCPIDQMVMEDPYTLSCGHRFCRFCIHCWLNRRSNCPVCRLPATISELKSSPSLQEKLDHIKIRCMHKECKWTGSIREFRQIHIPIECPMHPVDCPYGCDSQIERNKLEEHYKVCEFADPLKVEELQQQLLFEEQKNQELQKEINEEQKRKQMKIITAPFFTEILSLPTETLLEIATVANSNNLLFDLSQIMIELVRRKVKMDFPHKKMISTGFRHFISELRSSLWSLRDIEEREKDNPEHLEEVQYLILSKSMEIESFADKVLRMLQEDLFKMDNSLQEQVLFIKMHGDFLRFKAENRTGSERKEFGLLSEKIYLKGLSMAEALPFINPIRLGIILNYTVLLYEILKEQIKSIDLAMATLAEIKTRMEIDTEENVKQIAECFSENIKLWVSQIASPS